MADETASDVCWRHADPVYIYLGVDYAPESGFDGGVSVCSEIYDTVVDKKLHIDASCVDFISDYLPHPSFYAHGPAIVQSGKDVCG